MPSPRVPLAVVLVATFALVGCTAETSDPGDPTGGASVAPDTGETDAVSTPLEAAFERMPVGDGQVSLAVTDVHRAEQLGAYEGGANPFSTAGVLGFGALASVLALLDGVVPDGALENARASSGGVVPDTVVRFDGVANPGEALAEVAGERSELAGGTLLVRRDDYAIDFADTDFPAQALAHLNVLWFDDATIIAGTARANVESWVAPSGATAASAFPGLAACLGDAIGVSITSADLARTSSDVGIGYGESDGALVQTLCVHADDPAAAVDRISENIGGSDPLSGRAWSELLGDVLIEDAGDGWVRVRSDDGAPNVLFSVLQQGGLGALVD